MGKIEEVSKKRTRNQKLKLLVLGSVTVVGMLAIGLVAPNVLGAMAKLGLVPKSREDEYIAAARRRLKRQGLLEERDGFLRITTKGQAHLRRLLLSLARPARMKRWDEKWRILIFDIPERRKNIRARIREQLGAAGFARLQDSVWVYPYPCEEFAALLKAEFRIGKDMLYLIVDTLEGDADLRKKFALPRSRHAPEPPLKLPALIDTLLSPILPTTINPSGRAKLS